MSFAHEKMLWLMAGLVPLLAWFLWWTWRKRQAVIRQFVQNRFLEQLAIGGAIGFQKLRRVLLLLAVIFLLLALARPQWGFSWEEATQRGRDVIVAIDTSKSMLAEDIQPNRLERAKLAALDLLQIAKYDRLGLVAFAGTAFLQCPLTLDDEAYRQSVQILQPGIIPQGGTALTEAIQAARAAFNEDEVENHKILILFTDGEDHEENVMELVQKVAGEGMHIFTVGVGTPAGELLRVRDESGNLSYLKDESGNVVKSRLNEQLLQQIATAANGFYLPLRGANAMEILYRKGLAPLPTSERSSKLMKRLKEQYYWPLSIAILLLVLEIFLPERRAPKREEQSSSMPSGAPVPATAAAILVLLLMPGLFASPAKALKNYKSGEYKSAYYEYKRLVEKDPADPRLQYNAGTSAYQSKKFDEAVKSFQAAVAAQDPVLQEQAYYNLGNSEFRLGESDSNPQQKIAQWEQAVQHYDAALKMNANDNDAQFNKELVQKKIKELKKQQQQEQKQNQQNKDKNENNKDRNQDQKDQQKNNEQQNKEDKDQQKQQKQKQDNDSEKQNQNKHEQQQHQEQQQQQEQQEKDKQQQQAANQQQKDKDKSEQGQPKPGEEKESEQGQNPEEAQAAQYAQLGKMTPAQAKQLLDAQKGEEKAMIFIPPQKKSSQQNRSFKDW